MSVQQLKTLLGGLSRLQQLQRLDVQANEVVEWPQLPPAASYAALTASSQLTALLLTDCSMQWDAAQHMFAAGRQLPHLQQLAVAPSAYTLREFSDGEYGQAALKGCSLRLQPGYAAQLAACCHNLQSLSLLWATSQTSAASLQPLTTLTRLTSLWVGGDGWSTAAAEAVLSRLTGRGWQTRCLRATSASACFCLLMAGRYCPTEIYMLVLLSLQRCVVSL
jgi:hypothetical protein